MKPRKLLAFRPRKVKRWNPTKAQLKEMQEAQKHKKKKIKAPARNYKQKDLRKLPQKLKIEKHLERPETFFKAYFRKNKKYRLRKNQKNLSSLEWNRFLYAIQALSDADNPGPSFQDFVKYHRTAMMHHNMHWKVHKGINFLTWHREYLVKLEARLMIINPLVTIPYWNWLEDREIPAALNDQNDFKTWGIERGDKFNGDAIGSLESFNQMMKIDDFEKFSTTWEQRPFHDMVHVQVGGTMATSGSPADPLFWLHHAFIDKIFADWQLMNPKAVHPNPGEKLMPQPIFSRSHSQVWNIKRLGYVYE